VVEAMRRAAISKLVDSAFKELVLALPLWKRTSPGAAADVEMIRSACMPREAMRVQLATALRLAACVYEDNFRHRRLQPRIRTSSGFGARWLVLYVPDVPQCIAARESNDTMWPGKTLQRFKDAGNMTDRFQRTSTRWCRRAMRWRHRRRLARFHSIFKDEALVIDKWFPLQAGAPDSKCRHILPLVKQLLKQSGLPSTRTLNRARSVISSATA
jgi:aminopeptidase N